MNTQTTDNRLRVEFPAELERVDTVDDVAAAFLADRQVPVDVFAVRLLLRETLSNAVLHGCSSDNALHVRFELRIEADGVALVTSDPGPGFDWRRVQSAGEMDASGGRGLPLMDAYADDVSFNEVGNVVSLRIPLRAAPSSSRSI